MNWRIERTKCLSIRLHSWPFLSFLFPSCYKFETLSLFLLDTHTNWFIYLFSFLFIFLYIQNIKLRFSNCSSVINLSILFHKFLLKIVTPDDGWCMVVQSRTSSNSFILNTQFPFPFSFPPSLYSLSSFFLSQIPTKSCSLSFILFKTNAMTCQEHKQKKLQLGSSCCYHCSISGLSCITFHILSYWSLLVLHLHWSFPCFCVCACCCIVFCLFAFFF